MHKMQHKMLNKKADNHNIYDETMKILKQLKQRVKTR